MYNGSMSGNEKIKYTNCELFKNQKLKSNKRKTLNI